MDPGGDGGGGLTAMGLSCTSCGTQLPPDSRFCNKCGAPITPTATPAEYKQVTVLFADVVHSMDIAKSVGAERLREIMAGLVDRAATVVKGYGGTLDKFTGDGIMAVFGAPIALEDHALRACRAALEVHSAISDLADEVSRRDGVDLQLRIGLNSGQVIVGEIGSGGAGYTAIGEQVGLAQRMESVAPPGGVMLSASTARLVEAVASLGDPELVHIKGTDQPVVAQRLVGLPDRDHPGSSAESALVGRHWEMGAVQGLLQRAVDGHGAVVTVVGSPGIGKSRLVREVSALAETQGVEVFSTYCESHTTQVPFHAVARLLRAATGIRGLDGPAARAQVRAQTSDADPEDLLLFEDLLGIADPEVALPKIDPDARRRRLTALVNTASLAREAPAVYVIEDAHWIDEVSESMLADFFTVIPQTPSLVLVTYRPEYSGLLSRVSGAPSIALAPLSDPETATLVGELVGPDPSAEELAASIVERSAGNPFFAQEIVRDLAERGALQGQPGGYVSTADVAAVSLPATVQATIAARIDRLNPAAKQTLGAAAVVGAKFSRDLLETLGIGPVFDDLVGGQFVDQVSSTGHPDFVFHHPLIRTVAYESQLKSDRADLHRQVAAVIESRDPTATEENAALIAEHLQAAGEERAAFGWHMRAASWLASRDIGAASTSWELARRIADQLPVDDSDRIAMQTAPRTMLCGMNWLIGGGIDEVGLAELRSLCAVSGDQVSLAMGMAGQVLALAGHNRNDEATLLASELTAMLETIADPHLTRSLLPSVVYFESQVGRMTEALRLAQRCIELAEGDPDKGGLLTGSPLVQATMMRGLSRLCLGIQGWRSDADSAVELGAGVDHNSNSYMSAVMYKYIVAVPIGALSVDAVALRQTADALRIAGQVGDDHTLALAHLVRGVVLVHGDEIHRREGLALLVRGRDIALRKGFTLNALAVVDPEVARDKALTGDLDGAIELSRAAIDDMFERGAMFLRGFATTVLVDALLARRADGDLQDARAAIERLEEVPTDPGFVLHELPLLRLRALLAQALGEDTAYCDYRDRYRKMATDLGFEGHMKWAEAMT